MNSPRIFFVGMVFLLAICQTPFVYSRKVHAANNTSAPADDSSAPVTFFKADAVAAGFAKGATLFDGTASDKNYKVLTARRDKPGEVEIHTLDTDVIYVLEGSDTFVTGGTAVNAKTTAPNELRGTSIEGGETRELKKGDVVIVPKGVPHCFTGTPSPVPFLYFVVKVR
jgi:mannose-6-phosphate isomerase-like protein (cupin superfamily)